MLTQATAVQRFVRRTRLAPHEYRKNFRQLDDDIIATVTSPEADKVTPLMSKVYLRLVNAPASYYEREGVLRFESEEREGQHVKAWSVLCEVLGVASATANKALRWLHEQGIIGYFAGKNGVGVRIFLNRAATSIGVRAGSGGEKILPFAPASKLAARASSGEAAFKDSFAVPESLDSDYDPCAPKCGADIAPEDESNLTASYPRLQNDIAQNDFRGWNTPAQTGRISQPALNELATRLRAELEPALATVAARAAQREHERTREWLAKHGLPKAARVAQREAYNLLRQYGVLKGAAQGQVGREVCQSHSAPPASQPLPAQELEELASMCLAMLEVHGQPVETTLAALGTEAGGYLSPADAAQVQALAAAMIGSAQVSGADSLTHAEP
ncbi:MAG TPA: hypothetical protein VF525_19570 [Pyrinomonadaceae bacterium]|jgi:hypothetical protein